LHRFDTDYECDRQIDKRTPKRWHSAIARKKEMAQKNQHFPDKMYGITGVQCAKVSAKTVKDQADSRTICQHWYGPVFLLYVYFVESEYAISRITSRLVRRITRACFEAAESE